MAIPGAPAASAAASVAAKNIRIAGIWYPQEEAQKFLSRLTTTRRRRSPSLPAKYSPSRIFALRLKAKNEYQRRRYAPALRAGALQRNERLSLLTFQAFQRKSLPPDQLDPELQREWRDRLASFVTKGYTEQELDHWVWIFSADDGDSRVKRFLSSTRPQPVFVVLLLLNSAQAFKQPQSLVSLIKHVEKRATPRSWPGLAENHPLLRQALSVDQFLIFLHRIVPHVQRVIPPAIVTVARLAAKFIRNMPPDSRKGNRARRRNCYTNRRMIFNTALLLFSTPAKFRPLIHMDFNWRAQKILLAVSDSLERRLIVNKSSFRAIRKVMIGLRKSTHEHLVARRYAKSWPPYRQDFDGLDAKRSVEDDYSRSVKAGVLMKEEGYTEDDYDQALNNLGGTSAESPTIQTRSLPPKEWKGEKTEWNFFNRWAMKIRATRNAHEAWRAFTRFSDLTPNFQVYAEMFLKLHARPVDEGSSIQPGDSRETFPVHRANYSEYELARQTPPSVAELYNQMISSGTKPEGYCLNLLVRNARTVEEGLRYLLDSGMDHDLLALLADGGGPLTHRKLLRIPLVTFSSFVELLCRLQPDRWAGEPTHEAELVLIRHAIRLIRTRLVPHTTEGVTFRPPWHAVLRALARPYIRLLGGTSTRAEDSIEALALFTSLLDDVDRGVGLDTEIFIFYCHAIQNTALTRLLLPAPTVVHTSYHYPVGSEQSSSSSPQPRMTALPLVPARQAALARLTRYFRTLTATVEIGGEDEDEDVEAEAEAEAETEAETEADAETEEADQQQRVLPHIVGPWHLHAYMRALAYLEDAGAMADAMEWVLRHRAALLHGPGLVHNGNGNGNGGGARRGPAMIAKTLCAFQAFARPALDPARAAVVDRLMDAVVAEQAQAQAQGEGGERGGGLLDWRWPTPAEVEQYLAADLRRGSLLLRERCLALNS